MAKLPKVGGLGPGDENYKLLMEGLEKREKAMKDSAEEIKSSAETINQNTKEQSKIGQSLNSFFNNFKRSFSGGFGSGGGGGGGSGGGSGGGAIGGSGSGSGRSSIPNILINLLNVNRSILKFTHSNNDVLIDILAALSGKERDKIEERREKVNKRASVEGTGAGIGKALSGAGDLFGGIGNMFGGMGGGLAKLLGGAGIAAFLLSEADAAKIKKNVETLLSIGEGYESKLEFLKDGGILSLMLYGIGKGLTSFAIGDFAVGIAEWVNGKLGQENWAQKVVDNVTTLLKIADLPYSTADTAWLSASLIGIGSGLAVFGIGEGIKGGADAIQKGISFLTGDGTPWAQRVYDEVKTLLAIGELPHPDTGWLSASLAGIGLGLAVFGGGKAIEGVSQGFQGIINFFSGNQAGWAQRIYDEVKTLMSISDLPHASEKITWFADAMAGITAGLGVLALGKGLEGGVNTVLNIIDFFSKQKGFAQRIYDEVSTFMSIMNIPHSSEKVTWFADAMAGITAGLGVFALGKGLEGGVNTVLNIIDFFSKQKGFAQRIYDEVDKLLSITLIETAKDGGEQFYKTMSTISKALLLFTTSNLVSSLENVGSAILNFLTNKEDSPFEGIKQLARDAPNLEKGANALEKVANALTTFSNIKTGDLGEIDFKGMAENLGKALPLLKLLSSGGILKRNTWYGLPDDIDFGKGILDPNLKLDQMAAAISKINYVLGRTTEISPVQGNAQNITNTSKQNAVDNEGNNNNVIVVPGGGTSNNAREPANLKPRNSGFTITTQKEGLLERMLNDRALYNQGVQ